MTPLWMWCGKAMRISRSILITLLIVFIVGLVVGRAADFSSGTRRKFNEKSSEDYKFLNRTAVANLGKYFIINFTPLRKEFEGILKRYGTDRSFVYFVYLGNAAWTGINERATFVAASTIKVPLAMAIFKAAEDGKLNLDERFSLSETELDEHFGPLYKEGAGKDFSIRELIKVMLEQSDNTAMNALFDVLIRIGIERPFDDVYMAMGWDAPNFGAVPVYTDINLKVLSNMFLSLYNGTYISLKDSNEILSYLANTPFDKQIDAGVPPGVEVAHKIGVSDPDMTYSDCGIVYAPSRDYLLCAAIKDSNQGEANRFLQEISAAAYKFVIGS